MSSDRASVDGHPLITLAIRHYNNAPFVAAALEGAFAQTYRPLEILFVDDCSTDGGCEIARSMIERYSGPHDVVLARNERNIGCGAQTMRVRDLAKGEIIVFADADDVSLPQRCQRIYEAFEAGGPQLLGVISYLDSIDEGGNRLSIKGADARSSGGLAETWTPEMVALSRVGTTGALLGVRRRVLELGVPFDILRRGDDLATGFRCAVLGRLMTIPEALVLRRIHRGNVSSPTKTKMSAAQRREWFARMTSEAILVPVLMQRDLAGFERQGLIAAERAASLRKMVKQHIRRVKLLRVAARSSALRAWLCVFELTRLGLSLRESVRQILPAAAPRLEIWRERRIARAAASRATRSAVQGGM